MLADSGHLGVHSGSHLLAPEAPGRDRAVRAHETSDGLAILLSPDERQGAPLALRRLLCDLWFRERALPEARRADHPDDGHAPGTPAALLAPPGAAFGMTCAGHVNAIAEKVLSGLPSRRAEHAVRHLAISLVVG